MNCCISLNESFNSAQRFDFFFDFSDYCGGGGGGGVSVATSSKVKPTSVSNETSIRNLTTPHQTNKQTSKQTNTRPIKEWGKTGKPQNTSRIPQHFMKLIKK